MIRNIILNTEKDIRIAASIGMCSTEVTDEYNALYCCAESTLKYVKDHGRGNAALLSGYLQGGGRAAYTAVSG